MNRRPALFLDRDGVINIDHGYVNRSENFEFIDGIFNLCHAAQKMGFLLIIITNQAGIGRGYYTESDFHTLTEWMKEEFERHGISITDVYFSPYHPEFGIGEYKLDSSCRKPKPGMILQAVADHNIDLSLSALIGDKTSDIEAGIAAGVGLNIHFHSIQNITPSNTTPNIAYLLDAIPLLEQHRSLINKPL